MPSWNQVVDLYPVWTNDELSFEEKRDQICTILRDSNWFKSKGLWEDLPQAVLELSEVDTVKQFDMIWGYVLDEADLDRVWIAMMSPPRGHS